VVRSFSRFRPFPIRLEDGRRRTIDSLVFANIDQMAKYATLSEGGRPDDGRFEVITQRRTGKLRVLGTLIRAATRGLGPSPAPPTTRSRRSRRCRCSWTASWWSWRRHSGRRRHRTLALATVV
jgi:hypothetical protein